MGHIEQIVAIRIRDLRVKHHPVKLTPGMRRVPSAGGCTLARDTSHPFIPRSPCQITKIRGKIITVPQSCSQHFISMVWLPALGRPYDPSHISAVPDHIVETASELRAIIHPIAHTNSVKDISSSRPLGCDKIIMFPLFCHRTAFQTPCTRETVVDTVYLRPLISHLAIALEIILPPLDGRPFSCIHPALRCKIILFPFDELPAFFYLYIMFL